MVAMQVRNEYMVDEREVYVLSAKLQLCTFATIYHELFVANSHYLGTGIVAGCGKRRPATEYVYFKWFHL